jgi:hypothetical protein
MLEKEKSRTRRILERIFFSLLVVFIFWLIFRRVPFDQFFESLKRVEPVRFFICSFSFVLLCFLVDAYTHYVLLKNFNYGLNLRQVFELRLATMLFVSLGYFYGQGGIAYIISKHAKKPVSEVVGILAFLFFNTFHATVFLITLGEAIFLPRLGKALEFKWLWFWIIPDWIFFFLWLFFWQSRLKNFIPKVLRDGILRGFAQAKPFLYLQMIGLRILMLCIISFFVWLAFPAFQISVPFSAVFSLLPIQNVAFAIPTPGRYGINEGSFLLLFKLWTKESALVAFAFLWGTSANLIRSFMSLITIKKFRME